VLWTTCCFRYFHSLQLGDLVAIEGFRVQPSKPPRMHVSSRVGGGGARGGEPLDEADTRVRLLGVTRSTSQVSKRCERVAAACFNERHLRNSTRCRSWRSCSIRATPRVAFTPCARISCERARARSLLHYSQSNADWRTPYRSWGSIWCRSRRCETCRNLPRSTCAASSLSSVALKCRYCRVRARTR
jgi:hypothetical protein